MALSPITERLPQRHESAVLSDHLGGPVIVSRGRDTLEILPFDLFQIDVTTRKFPYIWHGSCNGETGVFSTYEEKTRKVME